MGSRKPDVGIVFSIALIRPHDIKTSPEGAFAFICHEYRHTVTTVMARNIDVPSPLLFCNNNVIGEPKVAPIKRTVQKYFTLVRPCHKNFPIEGDGGNRAFGRVIIVDAIPRKLRYHDWIAPFFSVL